MWNFELIPNRLRAVYVRNWRAGNKSACVRIIKHWKVYTGDCDNCLREQLSEWTVWAIEQGPLKSFSDDC